MESMSEVNLPLGEASGSTSCGISSSDETPIKRFKPDEDHFKDYVQNELSGIFCCVVCFDLPNACYQCYNGHLMCAGCFNYLLADARLKDETATCPSCRFEINIDVCTRNLAVEKAVSELPSECSFCGQQMPRYQLDFHQRELCLKRVSPCRFAKIGCGWTGPFHEVSYHEENCSHPKKTALEVMVSLEQQDSEADEERKHYSDIFSLLSYENITVNDLQLKPFRHEDENITHLIYETSRFTAFRIQWIIKAKINSEQQTNRSISYQLVARRYLNNPISLRFLAVTGPFGCVHIKSKIYSFEFTDKTTKTEYNDLLIDPVECNKLLSSRIINFRLIMSQVENTQ